MNIKIISVLEESKKAMGKTATNIGMTAVQKFFGFNNSTDSKR
jgi:hypothetical protein